MKIPWCSICNWTSVFLSFFFNGGGVKIPTDPPEASVSKISKMPPKRKETGENSSASEMKKMKKQQQSSTENEKNSSSSRDDGEDRISSLPEANLHHILFYLDMKQVVQTSILSKRWRDLWTSVRSLTFDSELFYSPTTKRFDGFQNFVDQVLLLRDNSDIDIFDITSVSPDCDIKSRLNTWILSVIRSKVEQLYIDIWGDGIRLPNSLFTCNTLTRLILWMNGTERWGINLPDSMCLPNLNDLHLCSVSFHDENLTNKFFLSVPKLLKLVLGDVDFLLMNVNISCPELEILEVYNLFADVPSPCWPDSKFKLHAPHLYSLTCQDMMSKDYMLGNLPSLVKADIDMKVEEEDQNPGLIYLKFPAERKQMYAQRMMQFLSALHYVEDLKLSAWFLEVVTGSLDLLECEPTELCDLTCLRLETWFLVDTIRAIAYLLKISPNIQSLFLEISQVGSEIEGSSHLEAEMSFPFLLDKLEIVEIQGAVGCADELNFLEVLLKNANALKKLVVCTSTEPSPDSKKRFRKFSEKLLMFPRASSNISILFY